MLKYEFKRQDAFDFARFIGIPSFEKSNELFFKECPYCKGGGHGKDRETFSINLNTGQFKCFRASCGRSGNMVVLSQDFDFKLSGVEYEPPKPKEYKKLKQPTKKIVPKQNALTYLESRGIPSNIAEEYQITVQNENENNLVFPFFDDKGVLQCAKYRNTKFQKGVDKAKEWFEKDTKPILFGMYQCKDRKRLVISEGQMDSLSVATSGVNNAVSVPNGAKGFTWVANCYKWVEEFEEICVFGDFEKGHMTLIDDIQKRFDKPIYEVQKDDYMGCKDANEILQKYGKEQVKKCVDNAKLRPLPMTISFRDVGRRNGFDIEKVKTGFDEIDRLLYGGLPFGGVSIITGKSGLGKSTVANQIVLRAIDQGYSCFVYSGELPVEMLKDSMCYQLAGANHVFEYQTKDGYKGYNYSDTNFNRMSEWVDRRMIMYNIEALNRQSEELVSLTELVQKVIKRNNTRVILIDNLMTAIDCDLLEESNMYDKQSKFVKKLVEIAIAYKVVIILVAHKRKNGMGNSDNDEVMGSSNIVNLSSVVLGFDEDRDDNGVPMGRLLSLTKNRYFGKKTQGQGIHMDYDEKSKRVYSTEAERLYEFGWSKGIEFESVEETEEEIPFD